MNQQCKVCGEPAAGFHFGAFTCEGCKSFFGRSYNNLSSISECKNNGECVINKKNRTACKACRLRKCLLVGMSKSGSRYGRRSNWFKIHCLLQEQQQAAAQAAAAQAGNSGNNSSNPQQSRKDGITPPLGMHHHPSAHHPGFPGLGLLPPPPGSFGTGYHLPRTKEELLLLGLDDGYKQHSTSPSVSSPESHNSDSSVEVSDARKHPHHPVNGNLHLFPSLLPPHFLPPPGLLFPPGYPPLYPGLLQPSTMAAMAVLNNNNTKLISRNHETQSIPPPTETFSKRIFLDAVLQSQRSPTPPENEEKESKTSPHSSHTIHPRSSPIVPENDHPMDLSMKSGSISPSHSGSGHSTATAVTPFEDDDDRSIDLEDDDVHLQRRNHPHTSDGEETEEADDGEETHSDNETLSDNERQLKRLKLIRPTPLDLTTKV